MPYILLLIFLVLAGAFLLLRLLTFRVEIGYERGREGDRYLFRVSIPPIIAYETHTPPQDQSGEENALIRFVEQLPAEESQTETESFLEAIRGITHQVRVVQQIVLYLMHGHFMAPREALARRRWLRWALEALARIRWNTDKLLWVTRVGAGDPALTGMVAGLLWGSKAAAFGTLGHRMTFGRVRPVIRVIPNFTSPEFATRFHCILRVPVGHIIDAGLGRRAS